MFESIIGSVPYLGQALMIIGLLRVLVKPVFSLFHAFADYTPSAEDNAWLLRVENSSGLKSFLYILDWFGSLKIVNPAQMTMFKARLK